MSPEQKVLIGIDGGATKTRGILTTEEGEVLATANGGSTNQFSNTMDVVKWNLQNIIEHLLTKSKHKVSNVRGICLGLAGVDKPADAKRIYQIVAEIMPRTDIEVANDSLIALYGGCLKPYGIIIISGTGSIAFGKNQTGEHFRSGGWGHILGDEGSGYAIGLACMRAVCRASDRRGQQTALTDHLLHHLNLKKPIELLDWVKKNDGNKAAISSLAPLVHKASEQGDVVAESIVDEQAEELLIAIRAVRNALFSLNDGVIEVVAGGGNLLKNKTFFKILKQKTEKHLSELKLIYPKEDPVYGAIFFLQLKYGLVKSD